MMGNRPVAFWCCLLGLFGLFGLFAFWGFACVLSPIIMLCSFPFNDDLGTPPTWRPYSWKKIMAPFHSVLDLRIFTSFLTFRADIEPASVRVCMLVVFVFVWLFWFLFLFVGPLLFWLVSSHPTFRIHLW